MNKTIRTPIKTPTLAAAALLAALGASCREGGNAPKVQTPPPDPVASSPAATTAQATNAERPLARTDVAPTLHVVLDDPRLTVARDRASARDYSGAAKAIAEARARASLDAEDACRWSYVAGKMHLSAGELADAEADFDRATSSQPPSASDAGGASCALSSYASLRAAQAYLRSGSGAEAATRARAVDDSIALHDDGKLALAEALATQADVAGAVPIWRAVLAANASTPRWVEASVRLASALLDGADGAPEPHAQEAFDLSTRVVVEGPRVAEAAGAQVARARAVAILRNRNASFSGDLTPAQLLHQAQAMLDEGDAARAVSVADALIAKTPAIPVDELACKISVTRAQAARGPGRVKPDAWGNAIARCSGDPASSVGESLATALYFGGKASASAGLLPDAMERFAKVERLFPKHRLADDARFQAALVAHDMGDEPRSLAMMSTLPDAYPDGDMRGEALFHVALPRMLKGDLVGAREVLDRALAVDAHDHFWSTGGRAAYFRARVAQLSGDNDDAKARYAQVVRDEPLAYYMSLAYARLAAMDATAAQAALGLGEYLGHYPAGRWKYAWEVAFPRAFEPLVMKSSEANNIPAPLTWAIMREESAFRADAKSHSNAIGLMQLLMGTAKGVAHGTGLPTDEESLKHPEVSIPLGAKLLGSLRRTYPTNPELAIAAYNSGAGNVKRWLQARGSTDFDLWVEQIPFDETRNYEKRVLRSEVAYAFLYSPDVLDELLDIPVRVTNVAVASNAPPR